MAASDPLMETLRELTTRRPTQEDVKSIAKTIEEEEAVQAQRFEHFFHLSPTKGDRHYIQCVIALRIEESSQIMSDLNQKRQEPTLWSDQRDLARRELAVEISAMLLGIHAARYFDFECPTNKVRDLLESLRTTIS